jgi:hypothetical protein
MSFCLSAKFGDNSDLFPDILRLYVAPGSWVADVTYGKGVFWKRIPEGEYNLLASDIGDGVDARKLPYTDGEIDCVVLDPPYIYSPKGTIKASISNCYSLNQERGGDLLVNQKAVVNFYLEAMWEARRVLRDNGVLILKCKDTIESGKQFWMHVRLMGVPGWYCEDLFVLVQKSTPTMDPKWGKQKHARKNHSYFLVLRKVGR